MPNIKNKGPWDMGNYFVTPIDHISASWCLNNSIKVYPLAKAVGEWWIEIDLNGKIHRSPYVYTKVMVWEKLHEYYRYYYNKYKPKDNS
tara:strand:+ start:3786 stop:4052 length:267 start_codon:yes stop_codon:yes gene_type:complete